VRSIYAGRNKNLAKCVEKSRTLSSHPIVNNGLGLTGTANQKNSNGAVKPVEPLQEFEALDRAHQEI